MEDRQPNRVLYMKRAQTIQTHPEREREREFWVNKHEFVFGRKHNAYSGTDVDELTERWANISGKPFSNCC